MISAVILTKNEEANIVDCLESIDWCDELIVVDDYSTDRTLQVIKNFSSRIKIFQRNLDEDFSAQRNFGLSKVKGDWVLFVDADERLSNGLSGEIKDYLQSGGKDFSGFYIKRKDIIWGKELQHGETGNIRLLRFAKKNAGDWHGKVHELWEINGKLGNFNMPLLHYPHQTIWNFLREINHYTDVRAKELYDRGIRTNFYKIILYPKAKFLLNYFLKLGFLDGIEGLVFAIMMSFHSFLVRAKLWTYANKK